MIVVTLTDCPVGVRGDLTKWLVEIQSGVFVGSVSARVREKLWKRIQSTCKNGRSVMVYTTNNEQRLDFLTRGDTWEPIDFDGVKLMLRPSVSRLNVHSCLRPGFSKAARLLTATRVKAGRLFPNSYVVVDLETTGLDSEKNEIIQIAAVKIEEGTACGSYTALVQPEHPVPDKIVRMTGITNEMIAERGIPLLLALTQFLEFLGAHSMVSHNSGFDSEFLRAASLKCGLPLLGNPCIDTLAMSKRAVRGIANYKLLTLAEHLGIPSDQPHRGDSDCATTQLLYEKLVKLLDPK